MKTKVILILFFTSLSTTAQFSAEAFLSAAITDIELQEIQAAQDFVQNNKFNSPWLRELEFRAKSNDREISIEDYRLRFGFINPYEIRANKHYQKELDHTIQLRKRMKLNDVLKMRYELLIEHIYLSSQVKNGEKMLNFYTKLRGIVYNSSDENAKEDVLDLEDKIFKQRSRLNDIQQKLKINEYLIKEKLESNGSIELDTSSLITINFIFTQLNLQKDTVDLKKALADQEYKLRESRFTVEKAESFRNIGFFQAEYDIERGDELSDQLGYRIGVTIPVVNPDKPNLQRDRLALVENQAKQERRMAEVQRNREILQIDFEYIKEQMTLLDEQLRFIDVFESTEARAHIDLIRKSAEFRFLLESRKMGLFTLLVRKYIDKLYQNGKLATSPMVNHISRNLLPLSIDLE